MSLPFAVLLQFSRCCVLLCCLFCFALFALMRARFGFLCAFSSPLPALPFFVLPACCVLPCLFPSCVVFALVSPLLVVAGCPCSLLPFPRLCMCVCVNPQAKPVILVRILVQRDRNALDFDVRQQCPTFLVHIILALKFPRLLNFAVMQCDRKKNRRTYQIFAFIIRACVCVCGTTY